MAEVQMLQVAQMAEQKVQMETLTLLAQLQIEVAAEEERLLPLRHIHALEMADPVLLISDTKLTTQLQ